MWPHIRAALIALHLIIITLLALPSPEGGMDHFLRIPYTQEPAVLREAVRRLAIARATADDAPLRGQGLGPTLVA